VDILIFPVYQHFLQYQYHPYEMLHIPISEIWNGVPFNIINMESQIYPEMPPKVLGMGNPQVVSSTGELKRAWVGGSCYNRSVWSHCKMWKRARHRAVDINKEICDIDSLHLQRPARREMSNSLVVRCTEFAISQSTYSIKIEEKEMYFIAYVLSNQSSEEFDFIRPLLWQYIRS
jgi:hypothetical protein